nr:hypothetical protein [Tanacetum cinerariifolium]
MSSITLDGYVSTRIASEVISRPPPTATTPPPPENFSGGLFPAKPKRLPSLRCIRSPWSLSITRHPPSCHLQPPPTPPRASPAAARHLHYPHPAAIATLLVIINTTPSLSPLGNTADTTTTSPLPTAHRHRPTETTPPAAPFGCVWLIDTEIEVLVCGFWAAT